MFTAKRATVSMGSRPSALIRSSGRLIGPSFHVALRGVRVNFFVAVTVRGGQRVGWHRVGLRVLLYT